MASYLAAISSSQPNSKNRDLAYCVEEKLAFEGELINSHGKAHWITPYTRVTMDEGKTWVSCTTQSQKYKDITQLTAHGAKKEND